MRIGIVAGNASTRFGGEAILPVHYFRLLRSLEVECWLIVHARTRVELVELFPDELDRIVFVPDMWIHRLIFVLSGVLPRRLSEVTFGLMSELITQFCQRTLLRRLIVEMGIDVIHQPIPVAPRFPSMFFGLGAPVLIGPLNGGMEYPPAFRHRDSWGSRMAMKVVRLFVDTGNALLPGKKNADVILVANARTRRVLPVGLRGRVMELVENGIDVGIWHDETLISQGSAARFVFLGRFIDWKLADVAIRALVQVPGAELELIGDGPMAAAWRQLANELGIAHRVFFSGWLTQQECPSHIRKAVALVLPSIYESGGAAVLEAMAMAKPVIATNWGGPADYLDASCGILVEPSSYVDLVSGFASAMQRLMDFPEIAKAMGEAGRERATSKYDWQQKIHQVMSIYRGLAEQSDMSGSIQESGSLESPVSGNR